MQNPLTVNDLETQLIGKAHIYLQPLRYGIGIQQRTQVLDHRYAFRHSLCCPAARAHSVISVASAVTTPVC